MQSGFAKHFLIAGIIALVGYVALWKSMEHARTRKGPWEVTYRSAEGRPPEISIRQPSLGIEDVRVIFAEASAPPLEAPVTIRHDQPERSGPFGSWIRDDLIMQPGMVLFDFFGHKVELLPRTLIIDLKAYPWSATNEITLHPLTEPLDLPPIE